LNRTVNIKNVFDVLKEIQLADFFNNKIYYDKIICKIM